MLAKGQNALQLIGGLLLIVAIFIGPLLAGSYYEPWRWPLVYASALSALILILSAKRHKRVGLRVRVAASAV